MTERMIEAERTKAINARLELVADKAWTCAMGMPHRADRYRLG